MEKEDNTVLSDGAVIRNDVTVGKNVFLPDSAVVRGDVTIGENALLLPGAVVCGDVSIGERTVVWYNAVVRGDGLKVTIGADCHIEDNSVLHSGIFYPIIIGDGVTIGHGAIVHGCTVGDNSLIGMGAILMNDCHIGKDSIVAAGSVVPQHKTFPDGVLIMGSPAEGKRKLTEKEIEGNRENIDICSEMAQSNFNEH